MGLPFQVLNQVGRKNSGTGIPSLSQRFNDDNPKILPGRACCNGAGVSPGAGCQSVGARLAAVEEFFGTIDDRVFKLMPYMS